MATPSPGERFRTAEQRYRDGALEESLAILEGLEREYPGDPNLTRALTEVRQALGGRPRAPMPAAGGHGEGRLARYLVMLVVGCVTTMLSVALKGGHPLVVVAAPPVHAVLLGALALIVAGAWSAVRRQSTILGRAFRVFAWLILLDGVLALAAASVLVFWARPQLEKALADLPPIPTSDAPPMPAMPPMPETPPMPAVPSSSAKPARSSSSARHTVYGPLANYAIAYDNTRWAYSPLESDRVMLWINHRDEDGPYLMVMSQEVELDVAELREVALDSLRANATGLTIDSETTRQVNGNRFLCLELRCTLEGVYFAVAIRCHAGPAGIIWCLGMVETAYQNRYKEELGQLLDGLEVIPGTGMAGLPQRQLLGHWFSAEGPVDYYFGPNAFTVVYPGQSGRKMGYSVVSHPGDSLRLEIYGANYDHIREYEFHGMGKATHTIHTPDGLARGELTLVDAAQEP